MLQQQAARSALSPLPFAGPLQNSERRQPTGLNCNQSCYENFFLLCVHCNMMLVDLLPMQLLENFTQLVVMGNMGNRTEHRMPAWGASAGIGFGVTTRQAFHANGVGFGLG